MVQWNLGCLFFLHAFFTAVAPQDLENSISLSMKVYYEIGDQQWVGAKAIQIDGPNPGRIVAPHSDISKENVKHLLVKYNSGDMLRIKTIIHDEFDKETEYLSSAKACSLLQSPAILSVNLDHAGSVIGTTVSPTANCYDTGNEIDLKNLDFHYVFKLPESAPVPDTATYVNRLDREREAKERGATQDNRSFVAKYWMYIVPVAIFALLSGSSNSEPAGGQPAR